MSDPIWVNDFKILFRSDRAMEFFPIKEQTHEERVNAIMRLSLYISVLLSVYNSNVKYFSIFVFFMAFTFVVYRHHPEMNNEKKLETVGDKLQQKLIDETSHPKLNNFTPTLGLGIEKLENETRGEASDKCTKPTIANPFGNFTMADMMTFDEKGNIVDRPPACDPNDPEIKKMIDESFNNNLYRDVSDVFGKTSSQRNYYTMPWTTIINDQEKFQRWLYLSPKTCKEDSENCLQYEDLRSKRFIMPNPERNPVTTKKLDVKAVQS